MKKDIGGRGKSLGDGRGKKDIIETKNNAREFIVSAIYDNTWNQRMPQRYSGDALRVSAPADSSGIGILRIAKKGDPEALAGH